MSTATELESFIQKFHQLWNAGFSAHLDLDCHAGLASVGIRLQLGHPPPPGPFVHRVYSPPPPPPPRKSFSPSYRRRRERRIASRLNNLNAEKVSPLAESKVTTGNEEGAEEVSHTNTIRAETMKEIEENDDTFEDVIKLEETGEVLEENDDEQITEKSKNEEFANKNKSEEENEKSFNSADEVFCVAANSLGKASETGVRILSLRQKRMDLLVQGFQG